MDFDYTIDTTDTSDCPSEERVLSLVKHVFEGENVVGSAIGVVLTDHETVLELNKAWLEHDYHTDVISFLLEEDPSALEGEVYVDVETARERHAEFGTSVRQEIERYIVHGLLHLIGYDDATPAEKQHMHKLEDTYLGLDNAL